MRKTDGLTWFKSSYSSGDGDSCIEVAHSSAIVRVRDSKLSDSAQVSISLSAWTDFVAFAPKA